mmetsp:Transcript_18681/g.39304  ORF Transcript_18681/g.39304 Transcript_18681/m.39304 type:complete len:106 (+) Transcript_18681:131-448(+)
MHTLFYCRCTNDKLLAPDRRKDREMQKGVKTKEQKAKGSRTRAKLIQAMQACTQPEEEVITRSERSSKESMLDEECKSIAVNLKRSTMKFEIGDGDECRCREANR